MTLESLLRAERRAEIGDGQYYVCTTRDCETVYFRPGDGRTFDKPDVVVRFGLKETGPPRPVCYCFDHTVEEIHDEIRRTGRSTVLDSVKADMKGPGCRCEYTNPLGACCLKTVAAAVEEELRLYGGEQTAAAVGKQDHADCCAPQEPPGGEGRVPERAGFLAAGGSVLAAVFSSACCWLPLVLVAFGASAAGVAGFFEAYRPYLIVAAIGLLGTGYYITLIRKPACVPGEPCATSGHTMRIVNRCMLGVATVIVAGFVFFPSYVNLLIAAPQAAVATSRTDSAGGETVVFAVRGMSCEGCAATLRAALQQVEGVRTAEVSFEEATAKVVLADGADVQRSALVDAIRRAGFDATAPPPRRP